MLADCPTGGHNLVRGGLYTWVCADCGEEFDELLNRARAPAIAPRGALDRLTAELLYQARAAYLRFADDHPDRLPAAELVERPAREIVGLGSHHAAELNIELFDRPGVADVATPARRPSYTERLVPFMHVEHRQLIVAIAYSSATELLYAWWWRRPRGLLADLSRKRPPVA